MIKAVGKCKCILSISTLILILLSELTVSNGHLQKNKESCLTFETHYLEYFFFKVWAHKV